MSITGSDGNASVITDGVTMLQIDCGVNYKTVNKLCNYTLFHCRNSLLTHKHSDHTAYASDFMRYGMKVWATSKTWAECFTIGNKVNCRTFKIGDQFQIGTFCIKPFTVAHTNTDGSECENSGFLIFSTKTKEKLLWITDANYVENKFPPVDYIAIECNYVDVDDYADELPYVNNVLEKRRLTSHMSLNHCIQFLEAQDLSKNKWVKLLHRTKSQGNIEKIMLEKLETKFPDVNFIL